MAFKTYSGGTGFMLLFHHRFGTPLFIAAAIILLAGCSGKPADVAVSPTTQPTLSASPSAASSATKTEKPTDKPSSSPSESPSPSASAKPSVQPGKASGGESKSTDQKDAIQVVANPKDIAVLVNKTHRLPEGYKPDPLVEPNVPFTFTEKLEKRKMTKEAAGALEKLFVGAKSDGINLAGVSAYRSQATQETLFNNYVKKDGVEAANKYSSKPGFSEHQTGLAIDVAGSSGKCAVEDCFADTKEAKWLVGHSAEYGFIIRYLKGKESLTGYQYEPWHIRFVGKEVAKEITQKGITLEEYYSNAVPVSK
jgi:D-alanyl-D-alanine carboxypeptidase